MFGGPRDQSRADVPPQPPKKQRVQQETTVSLGPQVADGENVFGVAHIFAS